MYYDEGSSKSLSDLKAHPKNTDSIQYVYKKHKQKNAFKCKFLYLNSCIFYFLHHLSERNLENVD